ncbi:uncharacterized protein BX663DRAFT_495410 [Cokeromyces recurvatus]|uniref:uncharacterized protein n=1 Tax=Cokeromyces recurvatus TaxID=90255 RepID=UPI00221E95D9|nr:uncharacterized protein BX663DRAFT_495410 [Cokeromyces recurvatus]KAI7907281.1 hypothetical protein BX663DRAFT_495410 [Cokeromyces recurvatus]
MLAEKRPMKSIILTKKYSTTENQFGMTSNDQFESNKSEKKRSSWCKSEIKNQASSKQDQINDERIDLIRKDLIQRATNRFRRRQLEQNLENLMNQVVQLQTHLQVLHLDATATRNTIANLSIDDNTSIDEDFLLSTEPDHYLQSYENNCRIGRCMDRLEKRLEDHRLSLVHIQFDNFSKDENDHMKEEIENLDKSNTIIVQNNVDQELNKYSTIGMNNSATEQDLKSSFPSPFFSPTLSPFSVLSLPSLSLVSSIIGRASRASSVCESVSTDMTRSDSVDRNQVQLEAKKNNLSFDEPLYVDDPFYDLAGNRSFKAGSFCGSIYHTDTEKQTPDLLYSISNTSNETSEVRWRHRNQNRYQKHLELKIQRQLYEEQLKAVSTNTFEANCHPYDNRSIIDDDDDMSSIPSIPSLSNPDMHRPSDATTSITSLNINTKYTSKEDDFYDHVRRHPLSPVTPPPHMNTSFFFENHLKQRRQEYPTPLNISHKTLRNDENEMNLTFRPKILTNDHYEPKEIIPQQQQQQQKQPFFHNKSPSSSFHEYRYLHTNLYPQQNTLDELVTYLDGLGSHYSDSIISDGFHLLNNLQDCNQPFSQALMTELRERDHNRAHTSFKGFNPLTILNHLLPLLNPGFWCRFYYNLFYNMTCTGLEWCHFLSIITGIFIRNLLRGPGSLQERKIMVCFESPMKTSL